MEMNVGGLSCWPGGGGVAGGRSRRMDTVARGATTMKMINSTSITSTKGVTFMSLFCPRSNLPPPPPESFAAMEYSLAPEPFHRSVSSLKNTHRPDVGGCKAHVGAPRRLADAAGRRPGRRHAVRLRGLCHAGQV